MAFGELRFQQRRHLRVTAVTSDVEQTVVNRQAGRILGAVCFQPQGPRVNYNYLYNFSGSGLDFLRLQNNFYGVMHQRGIRRGFLWTNQTNTRLAALHESMGWRFDGLQDYFYLRSSMD
jgi:hypothetical protein